MKYFYLIGCLLFFNFLKAQTTSVSGKVYDPLTNEAIPFASVSFKNTTIATVTDLDGLFSLHTESKVDSVLVSCIGYLNASLPIKIGAHQQLEFALRQNKFDLPEIEINAGENPADIIMRKVRDNRQLNNKDKIDSYSYEAYNKVEFDINNISEKFQKRKIFKPFSFVFENIDSNTTNKKPYLPFFLSESISDIYSSKNPNKKKEIIKAAKVSGIENSTISQFMGDFYQNINIYDNFIYLFSKGFVSPIAETGNLYYKYYLLDSTYINGNYCYKLKFKPRRKQELTFTGEMWINDTTWAVKKIQMRIADDANINFVEDMIVSSEFHKTDGGFWMQSKDIMVINIAPTESKNKQTMGFIARKTTTYKNIKVNQEMPVEVQKLAEDVVVLDQALEKDDAYWQTNRHDSLTQQEQKIYGIVDTLTSIPAFQTYVNLITIVANNYVTVGKFDLGQIFSIYSRNLIEGSRFRFGGRTNMNFSKTIQLQGYAAYGLKDEVLKYGGGIEYFLQDKKSTSFGFYYRKDLDQLGVDQNIINTNNLFNSFFNRLNLLKFIKSEETKVFFDNEPIRGLGFNASFTHRQINPMSNTDFSYFNDAFRINTRNEITADEVRISLRYAYKEKFFERKEVVGRKRGRISLGSSYPITTVTYTRGISGIFKGDFTYHKFNILISDYLYLGNLGTTQYFVEGGKIWGTVPYPLLEIHKGNQTYAYDPRVYNLMNFYEFVSDEYLSLKAIHRFNGIILNRIPLLRKMKLREVASVDFLIGKVGQRNRDILFNPNSFASLTKPYIEASIGIENILKFGRISLVKRFSYLDNPNVSEIGVRLSFGVGF